MQVAVIYELTCDILEATAVPSWPENLSVGFLMILNLKTLWARRVTVVPHRKDEKITFNLSDLGLFFISCSPKRMIYSENDVTQKNH